MVFIPNDGLIFFRRFLHTPLFFGFPVRFHKNPVTSKERPDKGYPPLSKVILDLFLFFFQVTDFYSLGTVYIPVTFYYYTQKAINFNAIFQLHILKTLLTFIRCILTSGYIKALFPLKITAASLRKTHFRITDPIPITAP